MKTAEEFSENYTWTCCPEKSQVLEAMIEFAKFHLNNFSKQFDLSIWTKNDIIESYIKKHLK